MYKIKIRKITKMMKEIKQLNKWRYSMFTDGKTQYCQDVSSSQLDRCNPNQNPSNLFVDIDKLILNFIWRSKRPRIANPVLKEN